MKLECHCACSVDVGSRLSTHLRVAFVSVVSPLVCVCMSSHLHLNVDGFESCGEIEVEIASNLSVVSPIVTWLLTSSIPSPQQSQAGRSVISLRGFL